MAVGYFQGEGAEVIVCRGSTLSYPRHNHVSTLTLGLVLEGALELATDQGVKICGKNDLFTLPPYAPHSLRAGSPYTLVSLCVRKDLAAGAAGEAAALLRRAVGRPEAERRLLEGLAGLASAGRAAPGEKDGPLLRLRARLETEPELPLRLEDMAELACMSKYHLVRAFRQETGLTPHQFQLQNRVRKGQRLLGGPATVAEAASAAGFCDQSHFDRQFKRLLGMTPARYKRSRGALPPLRGEPG